MILWTNFVSSPMTWTSDLPTYVICPLARLMLSLAGLRLALWNSANQNPFLICRIRIAIDSANYERICKNFFQKRWLWHQITADCLSLCSCAVCGYLSICSRVKIKMSWLQPVKFIQLTPDHFWGRSTGCQSSIEWHTRWRRWRSRRCPQRQHIWMTWSRQLFQFVLCGHPTPRCWSSPKTRTVFARRSFSVAAPQTWNSLPSDVRSCRTVDTFKRHLKIHLFRQS